MMNLNNNEIKEIAYRVADTDQELRNIMMQTFKTDGARKGVEKIQQQELELKTLDHVET